MIGSFLLDTNIPSEMMKDGGNPAVAAWVKARADNSLYFSVISVGEVRKGIGLMEAGRRRSILEYWLSEELIPAFEGRLLPITLEICQHWGLLDATRRRAGRPMGIADGLIAATALVHGLTLVTRNTKDFVGLGLTIINPWDQT